MRRDRSFRRSPTSSFRQTWRFAVILPALAIGAWAALTLILGPHSAVEVHRRTPKSPARVPVLVSPKGGEPAGPPGVASASPPAGTCYPNPAPADAPVVGADRPVSLTVRMPGPLEFAAALDGLRNHWGSPGCATEMATLIRGVREDPACIDRILEAARDLATAEAVRSALFDVIGAGGSAAAQARLLEVTRDERIPTLLRVDAVRALRLLETPSPDARMELEALAYEGGDLGGVAAVVLGWVASREPGTGGCERSLAMMEGLLATRPEMAAPALEAIATSRTGRSVSVLAEALERPEPTIGWAAMQGLRELKGVEGAERALARALTRHPSAEVRIAAAEVAAWWDEPSVSEALRDAAAGDPDAEVRAAARQALADRPARGDDAGSGETTLECLGGGVPIRSHEGLLVPPEEDRNRGPDLLRATEKNRAR